MVCPFLDYRPLSSNHGDSAEDIPAEPRAYCEAADRFVQPLRADICNDRYDLEHDRDCEIYRDHVDAADDPELPDGGPS